MNHSDTLVECRVYVDWQRTGTFDGEYDDITARLMQASWSLGARRAYFDVADGGRATIQVLNDDGFFTPGNPTSPVRAYLLPLRPVRIELAYNGVTETMFTGYLTTYQRAFTVATETEITLQIEDISSILRDAELNIELLEDVTADEIIKTILGQVQLPAAVGGAWILGVPGSSELGITTRLRTADVAYDIDEGVITYPYVGDNWGNIRALQAIGDVVRAERGRFWFSREGVAVFRNRRALQTGKSVSRTYTTVARATLNYYENLANDVSVTARPRRAEANATLYELDEEITISIGETRTVQATYQGEAGVTVGGKDVVTPNVGDGSLAYTGGTLTISMEALASSANVTLTNTGGTDVTLTALTIKGTKLTAFSDTVSTASDIISIVQNGRRGLQIDTRLLASSFDAQQIANYELSKRKNPVGALTMIATKGALAGESIGVGILDAIRVNAMADADATYRVVGENHSWRAGGWDYEYQMFLEPADTTVYWTLGVAGASELGVTTRLGF